MIDKKSFYIMIKRNDFLPINDQITEIINLIKKENIILKYKDNIVEYIYSMKTNTLNSISFRDISTNYSYKNSQEEYIVNSIENDDVIKMIIDGINNIEPVLARMIFYYRYINNERVTAIIRKIDISQYCYYQSIRFASEQYLRMIKK